jgi:hypothetical protein
VHDVLVEMLQTQAVQARAAAAEGNADMDPEFAAEM